MKIKWATFSFFVHTCLLFAANPPTPSSWTNAGATGAWGGTNNWTPTTIPQQQGSIAQLINGVSETNPSVDTVASTFLVGSLTIDYGTAYSIISSMGGSLNFSATSGDAQITISTANGTGAHNIECPIALTSSLTVTQGSPSAFTISGEISENPAASTKILTMSGTGTLVLSSGTGNTYTGGTIITSGTLSVDTESQLGTYMGVSGGVTIGSGILQFTNSAPITTSRNFALTGDAVIKTAGSDSVSINSPDVISGTGSLEKTGAQTLILGNSNSYEGGTKITLGTLSISSDDNLGNSTGALNFSGGTLLTTTGITTARSGTITGTTSSIDTGGNTDTLSGSFTGSGALTVQGGGILNLTGTNSFTGGTTIAAASTLQGTTSGIQGNITLNGGTFLIFNQSTNGTYTGVLNGSGTLKKMGTGSVELATNSPSFTGPINVNEGVFNINASLSSASTTTVLSGATLSGAGAVGTVNNQGTLAPGNGAAIGNLAIQGDLTLAGTSNVTLYISPSSASQLAVAGTATLDGALSIVPESGFYGLGTSYTILTSSGLTLSPGFAPITSSNSAFVPTVTYVGNNAILSVEILAPFIGFPFSNSNTEAVGNNIDALSTSGQLSSNLRSVINSLSNQSFDTINEALDQMHPAQYSAFTELQAETGAQLISLFHRLPQLYCGSCCTNSNRLWAEPFGNSWTLKKHGMQIGSEANTGGIAFGYDRAILENWIIGMGGAWSDTHLEWHNQRGHGTVNGFYGGAYSDWQIDQFYVGASILAGMNFYETSRHIDFLTTNQHATADYKAIDIMAQLATAYLFGSPNAFFYPYANIDFLYLHTHELQEEGAAGLNLTVGKRSDSTLRTEIGLALQVQDTNMAQTMCISPQVSIGWVNMCPLERQAYSSTFEGATIPFTTHGWDISWNLLNVDFGLIFTYLCYSLGLQYNVEISPDEHTLLFNQHGNVRLDWKW